MVSNYSNKIANGFRVILGSGELYRPTYPLNFIENICENDKVEDLDIAGSVEKEIRYLFCIYVKILTEFENYKLDKLNLYGHLVSNELEHFILRYPVVFDIIEKHFLCVVGDNFKTIEEVVPLDNELKSMKKVRNEIIHHGAECIVKGDIYGPGFRISFNRHSMENHQPNRFLLLDNHSELYNVTYFITWMLNLLMNYLILFFKTANEIRTNMHLITEKQINEIKSMDKRYGGAFSKIRFFNNEAEIYKGNLEELLVHTIIYEKAIENCLTDSYQNY
ncbi:hypothetical protein CUU60_08515 [Paenibacillus polymyxa ATCC 842]|nr:hypothetical protein [Paenibacillus polymyxa]UOD85260.1 hypothetical protein CUU60_08515 [Paenibacillus polymyxa ATCC 842]